MPILSTDRRSLVLLTGLVALLSGAGLSHWLKQRERLSVEAESALWQENFELMDGSTLAMATLRDKPLVINFWATWCPPCVEEMPLLDAFFRQNESKGWQMLGIAIDQPSQIKRYWLHQANLGMNQLVIKKLVGAEAGSDVAPLILDEYANTASAGSIIAFHQHHADLKAGDQGVICSFGAGYSIGSVVVQRS